MRSVAIYGCGQNKEATAEALDSINNLDVSSEVKDELKTSLSDVIELSLRRKKFMEEYDDIKKTIGSHRIGYRTTRFCVS